MATKLQAKLKCEREGEEFVDNTLDSVGRTTVAEHYVKNKDLYDEIMFCKEHNNGLATDKLANMFINIATKLSNMLKYVNPDDKEDCIAYAVMDCINYFNRFDPTVTKNAFAYITSICTNGFAKGWTALGKKRFPDSIMVSLSDNIYSI